MIGNSSKKSGFLIDKNQYKNMDKKKQIWMDQMINAHKTSRTTTDSIEEIMGRMHPFGDYSKQLDILEPRNNELQGGILPLAMKVASQTIALDIIPVKPLSGPSLDLIYADYRYNDSETELVQEKEKSFWDIITNIQTKTLSYVWSFFFS